MSKLGNCGNIEKLHEFFKMMKVAKYHTDSLQFTVEVDPQTKKRFRIKSDDIRFLRFDDCDIYLHDEYLASWWDVCSIEAVKEL